MKKTPLGRNLSMLLSEQPFADLITNSPGKDAIFYLPVEYLQPGRYQPRRDFDETSLNHLADSIRTQGILSPIITRKIATNHYEIIAGERRWRAAQKARLNEVPVLVKTLSDQEALAISLIENIQRKDLNPLEEAQGIQRLIDEFSLTHQQLAENLGRSRTSISNLLRLLNLTPQVKQLLEQNQLEMGHARALLSLDPLLQNQAAEKIAKNKLSVRKAEHLAKHMLEQKEKIAILPSKKDGDINLLERQLSEKLGTKVSLKQQTPGKGQLIIYYNSLDELDGILSRVHEFPVILKS